MTHPIKEILLEELEQVTDALHFNLTDNKMSLARRWRNSTSGLSASAG